MLSQVKLIAEPWDVGPGGYQVGNFPPLWTEWNGNYRDTVRDFWRRLLRRAPRPRLPAHRLLRPVRHLRPPPASPASTSSPPTTASPSTTWSPTTASTTRPTGEGNRDGSDDNRSWNCGVEGAHRRPGDQGPAPAPAAQLPGHPVPVAGRADAARGRRVRPHPGRQQQRLLPGQRGVLDRLVPRRDRIGAAHVRPGDRRLPPRPPGVPPPPRSSPAASSPTASATSSGSPRRARRWTTPTGTPATPRPWPCSSTATPSANRARAASASPTTRSCC